MGCDKRESVNPGGIIGIKSTTLINKDFKRKFRHKKTSNNLMLKVETFVLKLSFKYGAADGP